MVLGDIESLVFSRSASLNTETGDCGTANNLDRVFAWSTVQQCDTGWRDSNDWQLQQPPTSLDSYSSCLVSFDLSLISACPGQLIQVSLEEGRFWSLDQVLDYLCLHQPSMSHVQHDTSIIWPDDHCRLHLSLPLSSTSARLPSNISILMAVF